jgi:hypothetical protein
VFGNGPKGTNYAASIRSYSHEPVGADGRVRCFTRGGLDRLWGRHPPERLRSRPLPGSTHTGEFLAMTREAPSGQAALFETSSR